MTHTIWKLLVASSKTMCLGLSLGKLVICCRCLMYIETLVLRKSAFVGVSITKLLAEGLSTTYTIAREKYSRN